MVVSRGQDDNAKSSSIHIVGDPRISEEKEDCIEV